MTSSETPPERASTVISRVSVDGMRTEHCKRAVFTALAGVPGIASADVQLGTVDIAHDGSVTPDQLHDAIAVAGYIVTGVAERRRLLPIV